MSLRMRDTFTFHICESSASASEGRPAALGGSGSVWHGRGMTHDERRAIEADCERLIRLYANLADAGEWARVAALYTEDGRLARPSRPDVFVEGREAILASFTARSARPQRHVVSNIVVEVGDAGHASAFSVMLLFTGEAQVDGGLPVRDATGPLVGSYTDRLVRDADGWRFVERVGGLDFRP